MMQMAFIGLEIGTEIARALEKFEMLTHPWPRCFLLRINLPPTAVLALFFLVAVAPVRAAPVFLEGGISISSGTCYADALIIYNLANYFISSYIIHASAIPVGADIGRYAQRVTRHDGWRWNAWLATISLFLPFFALARTTILIAQQIRCKGNGVLAALHHGALLVVVRDKTWAPSTSDEIVYTRLPEDFRPYDEAQVGTSLPAASIALDSGEENAYAVVDYGHHVIHGIAQPPAGYALAIPMRKSHTEILIKKHLKDTARLRVHYRPGAMGIVLSFIQIAVGAYNLYSARSGQIPRWGYAAYSLSVVPYVIMSVMNLLCAAIVDSYACAQLLRTPILEESSRRHSEGNSPEPEYDGTIGTVDHTSPQNSTIGQQGEGGYISVSMRTEIRLINGISQKCLVVNAGNWNRAYRLVPDGGEGAEGADSGKETVLVGEDVWQATISLVALPGRPSIGHDHEEPKPEGTVRLTVSALSHNGPPPKDQVTELDAITQLEAVTITCIFLIAMILPHGVIYAMSRFHANQSTVAQRAWMMAWLGADQFSACSTLACWVLWKKRQDVIPDWLQKSFYAILMLSGVGGFVIVAEMYLQDHGYGWQTCSL